MALRRWDPFRDLLSIQNEMTRLFSRTFGTDVEEGGVRGTWAPEIDVFETPEKFTVILELPGMSTEDLDITVDDGVLTIAGERKFYSDVEEENFYRIERRHGAFQRRITLPQQCDVTKIDASMSDGLLKVEIPKTEAAKPRRIEVKTARG
jgi:HSP20 family protein